MKVKTAGALLLCAALGVLLGGCRDYHGLDELTIVAGIAVDESEEDPELLSVTFEIIDLKGPTDNETPQSTLFESTGKTLADATYNASAKLHSRMYFGNCEILVVSEQVARTKGLGSLIDSMLRDHETRDNLHVLISGEKTAKVIITPPEESGKIISFNINVNIDTEEPSGSSTRALEMYQVYNTLARGTSNLVLPVIGLSDDDDDELKLSGMAIFTGDKLTGFFPEEEVPFYLLAVSKLRGGGYHVSVDEDAGLYAALSNRRSSAKQRVSFDGERFVFTIDIHLFSAVTEFSPGWEDVGYEAIRQLEELASEQLGRRIWALADDYRQMDYDIFELQDCVRNHEPALWAQVKDDWSPWLRDAKIQVNCNIKIDNTGLIEKY